MPITEDHEPPEVDTPTAHQETTAPGCETCSSQAEQPHVPPLEPASAPPSSDSGEERKANSEEPLANGERPPANGERPPANGEPRPPGVKLCRHTMEDGVFCQIPALSGRPYCYRHLRLRGQQMRIARALAQRQSFQSAAAAAGGPERGAVGAHPRDCGAGRSPAGSPPRRATALRPAAGGQQSAFPGQGAGQGRGRQPRAASRPSGSARDPRCPTRLTRFWREGEQRACGRGISRVRGRVRTATGTGPDPAAAGRLSSSRESHRLVERP